MAVGRPTRHYPPSAQVSFIAHGMKMFALRRKLERQSMATVIWGGDRFTATPVSQNADGSWVMEAQQRTARTVAGTRFTVNPNQIVAGTMPDTQDKPASPMPANEPAVTQGKPMRSRLSEKAKLVADGQKSLLTKVEGHFDSLLEAQKNSAERLNAAMQKIKDNQADIDAGTATIEDLANQLTNG